MHYVYELRKCCANCSFAVACFFGTDGDVFYDVVVYDARPGSVSCFKSYGL